MNVCFPISTSILAVVIYFKSLQMWFFLKSGILFWFCISLNTSGIENLCVFLSLFMHFIPSLFYFKVSLL